MNSLFQLLCGEERMRLQGICKESVRRDSTAGLLLDAHNHVISTDGVGSWECEEKIVSCLWLKSYAPINTALTKVSMNVLVINFLVG